MVEVKVKQLNQRPLAETVVSTKNKREVDLKFVNRRAKLVGYRSSHLVLFHHGHERRTDGFRLQALRAKGRKSGKELVLEGRLRVDNVSRLLLHVLVQGVTALILLAQSVDHEHDQ